MTFYAGKAGSCEDGEKCAADRADLHGKSSCYFTVATALASGIFN